MTREQKESHMYYEAQKLEQWLKVEMPKPLAMIDDDVPVIERKGYVKQHIEFPTKIKQSDIHLDFLIAWGMLTTMYVIGVIVILIGGL